MNGATLRATELEHKHARTKQQNKDFMTANYYIYYILPRSILFFGRRPRWSPYETQPINVNANVIC